MRKRDRGEKKEREKRKRDRGEVVRRGSSASRARFTQPRPGRLGIYIITQNLGTTQGSVLQ